MHDILDIETASGYAGGNEEWCFTVLEGSPTRCQWERKYLQSDILQSVLTLTLSTVRVKRSTRKTFVEEKIINEVSSSLVVDEDDCTSRWHRQ